jgi:hypothetical protein
MGGRRPVVLHDPPWTVPDRTGRIDFWTRSLRAVVQPTKLAPSTKRLLHPPAQVLTLNDSASLTELGQRILACQDEDGK